MNLEPLGDTLVVQFDPNQPLGPERSDGRPRVQRGTALLIGPGLRADARTVGRMSVKVGDTVYFAENAGSILHDEAGDRLLIAEQDIRAIDQRTELGDVPLYVPRPPRPTS